MRGGLGIVIVPEDDRARPLLAVAVRGARQRRSLTMSRRGVRHWGKDVADFVVSAVGRVEPFAVFQECFELGLEHGKVSDSCTDVGELGVDERDHVLARSIPLVAKVDDAANLGQCEPGGLGHVDETQPGEQSFVVDAVPVGAPCGLRQ